MDIGAFVQENRRWLIGIAIGALVFLIAYSVIGSTFDPLAPGRRVSALQKQQPKDMYSSAQVDDLEQQAETLQAEQERLTRMLAFERSPQFQVQAGAVAQDVLFVVGGQLKREVRLAADDRDVQIEDNAISYSVPGGVDDIQKVLFGLELINELQQRLFAAHDAARLADEEAMGLRAITQFSTELQKSRRSSSFRSRGRGRGRNEGPDLRDLIDQERVQFKFEAGAETLTRFFESCRRPGRTLVIENLKLQQPERITDPVVVSGSLVGIAFKQDKEQP